MENCVFSSRKEVAKMNKEILRRVKTAGEYQKKAIRALLPEKVNGHLDAIEKELKIMVREMAAEMGKEGKKREACEEEQSAERVSKVKKVDIA